MNLPNKITTFRIVMIPFLLAAALIDFPYHWVVTAFIYICACISDAVDGHIARKKNIVTDFGKLMDPLSDKALVLTAFVIFVKLGLCDIVCFTLILCRDFLVSGIRMSAAAKGKVIAANFFGKAKTVSQMVATIAIFVFLAFQEFLPIPDTFISISAIVLFWIACVLTVLSGIKYTKDAWYLIETK